MKSKITILFKVILLMGMMSSCRYIREWDELRSYHPQMDTLDMQWNDSSFYQSDKVVLVYDHETFFFQRFDDEDSIYLPYGEYYVLVYENDSSVSISDSLYYNRTMATARPVANTSNTIANLMNYFYCGVGEWKIAPTESRLQNLTWYRYGVQINIRLQLEGEIHLALSDVHASLSGVADNIRLHDGYVLSDNSRQVNFHIQENEDGSVLMTAFVFGFATDAYGAYINNRMSLSFGLKDIQLYYNGYDDLECLVDKAENGVIDTTLIIDMEALNLQGTFVPWDEANPGHGFFDQEVN